MIFSAVNKSKKRRHPRAKFKNTFLVAWQGGGRRDANRARNLGLGGIYISTTDPADVGTGLQLLFDTPEGEVRARAVVRSMHLGRGMGVEFIGMDSIARRRLYQLLKRLLDMPSAEISVN
ncbi:MAG: PilZ domain-containing protein [Candidatus Acidiferrales bacterium]